LSIVTDAYSKKKLWDNVADKNTESSVKAQYGYKAEKE
jgi:hypothetical protein